MVTDKKAFKENFLAAWKAYIILLGYNMTADEVADIYLKKSQVNKFRQRSNY
jgi:dimeric dUTPase (all-alpha-NTP-PPase superfamily)